MTCQTAYGGVWPQGEGHGYFNVSFTYLRYHEVINGNLFAPNGFDQIALKRTVSDHTLNGYLAYGLSDRLTFIGNVPLKLLRTDNSIRSAKPDPFRNDTLSDGSLNALSNVNIGAQYLLHRSDWLWSVQLMSGLQTAEYQDATGLRSGYDGCYLTPKIQLGRSWDKVYLSASLGYRWKTNGYSHDLVSDNEIGYKWERNSGKPTWFIFTFGGLVAITNGTYDDQNSEQTGLFRDEEGFIDPGIKINHSLTDHIALNLSSIGAVYAKHGGNELTYTIGLSYEW